MLRGIGLRALILIAVIVIVGIWVLNIAMDVAGAAIKFGIAIALIVFAIAAFTIAARKFKRR
jgi:hypothetical protein